jgi:hypothetical protein
VVLAVGAALDIENGRLVAHRDQSDRGPVTGYRRLRLAANRGLIEKLAGRILRDGDQRSVPFAGRQQFASHVERQHKCGAPAVVQIQHPGGPQAQPVSDAAAFTVERHIRYLGVGDQHVRTFDDIVAVAFDQPLHRALDHVDRSLVRCDVVAKLRRAEHDVVT